MHKLYIVLLADKWSHENMARALHALLYANQAKEAGAQVELVFDGAGAEWPKVMAEPNHYFYPLYSKLLTAGVIAGVCRFCSKAFHVEDELKALGVNFIGEDAGHPNLGKKAAEGWQVITL